VASRSVAAYQQDTLYSEGTAWFSTGVCYTCVIVTATPLPVVQLLAVPRCHWRMHSTVRDSLTAGSCAVAELTVVFC
jgi:hypothetical protein